MIPSKIELEIFQEAKIEIGNFNSNKIAFLEARDAIEKDLKEQTTENSKLKGSLKTLKERKEMNDDYPGYKTPLFL
jgi:hypothetical protein